MMVSLIFTASQNPISRLIRWITQSDVSHVLLAYNCPVWGGRWTVGAGLDGFRPHRAEKTCHNVVDEFECAFDAKPGMQAISGLLDSRYDFIAMPVFGCVILLWRWFRIKIRHPWNDPKHQICSEAIARFLMGCRLPKTEVWNPEATSPKRLKKYCLKYPDLFYSKKAG